MRSTAFRALALALCLTPFSAGETDASPDVIKGIAPDRSLTTAAYTALGMPDPYTSWSLNEYVAALSILGSIERVKLPRLDSKDSRLVFDRLVVSHNTIPAIAVSNASPKGAVSDLPGLYSPSESDGLLFDRELVAIRGSELKTIVSISPTLEETLVAERSVAAALEQGRGNAADLRRELEDYARLREQASEAIRTRFERLLVLVALEGLSDRAKSDFLDCLSEINEGMVARLSSSDRLTFAAQLRVLASLPQNETIHDRLIAIAGALGSANRQP